MQIRTMYKFYLSHFATPSTSSITYATAYCLLCERLREILTPHFLKELPCISGQDDRRLTERIIHHLDILPADRFPKPVRKPLTRPPWLKTVHSFQILQPSGFHIFYFILCVDPVFDSSPQLSRDFGSCRFQQCPHRKKLPPATSMSKQSEEFLEAVEIPPEDKLFALNVFQQLQPAVTCLHIPSRY
jgi:hypothetical protein